MGLTFHYVSISTRSDVHGSVGECLFTFHYKFTFHYVSISTQMLNVISFRMSIYIPLCIYFNYPRRLLHPAGIYIYIPLCIYFNTTSASSMTPIIIIYIPLCIYFNMPMPDNVHGCAIIYIPLCIYFNNISYFICKSIYSNLHSTMYLFQPVLEEKVQNLENYLHSTMYLFQRAPLSD